MEDKKSKSYAIIAVAAAAGLLVGCLVGAVVGGAAGLVVGRGASRFNAERELERSLDAIPVLPTPRLNDVTPRSPSTQPRLTTGVLVVQVVPGTPAEAAGLVAGDIIMAVDGTPINENHPLPMVVAQYRPGDRVTIHLLRAGQEQSVEVPLAEKPDSPGQPYLGVRVRMRNPGL